jgi:hypothetical protein
MSPHRQQAIEMVVNWFVPALLVLLIPVLAIGYVLDHQSKERTYRASLKGCERGNVLRDRINAKFAAYDKAFSQAAAVLDVATTPVGKRLHGVLTLAAATAPEPLGSVHCSAAYPKPRWLWQ